MTTIMQLPDPDPRRGDRRPGASAQGHGGLAGKWREMGARCALATSARFTHPPMAPKPYREAPQAGNRHPGFGKAAIRGVATPKAVSDAFARIAVARHRSRASDCDAVRSGRG